MDIKNLIDKLYENNSLDKNEIIYILDNIKENYIEYICHKALKTKEKYYSNKIFIRGLIEFTNHCKNNCYYCGIRCSNKNIERYRLSLDEILECTNIGYKLGYRTFVLQGGKDIYFYQL